MRTLAALTIALGLAAPAAAQDEKAPPPRFDVRADLENYPQKTPKEAFTSAIKAIERKRFDYLVAHVIDPAWVDARLRDTASTFANVVADVGRYLGEEPGVLREFRRFLSEGEFQEAGETTVVRLKDVKDRQVYLKKVGERWFLENRRTEEKAADKKDGN
jgi:hypothetical protein